MQPDVDHTAELQNWLDEMRRGNVRARNEAIDHACERLRTLTRKMLRTNHRVRRWSQTDDVLQNAMLRLHRSLAEVQPESARQFYALATTQIRRELIDLARHHYGPEGHGANHHSDGGGELAARADTTHEPDNLEKWSAFHEHAGRLPDEEREVFGLLWYEGLNQQAAATLLGVSLATVKRRWQSARLHLHEALREKRADNRDFTA